MRKEGYMGRKVYDERNGVRGRKGFIVHENRKTFLFYLNKIFFTKLNDSKMYRFSF